VRRRVLKTKTTGERILYESKQREKEASSTFSDWGELRRNNRGKKSTANTVERKEGEGWKRDTGREESNEINNAKEEIRAQ
jgi:hypothetical protein